MMLEAFGNPTPAAFLQIIMKLIAIFFMPSGFTGAAKINFAVQNSCFCVLSQVG